MVNGKGPVSGSYTSTIKYICKYTDKTNNWKHIHTLGLNK